MRPPGRPGRSRHAAPEFGRLVEIEIAKGNKVEAAMEIVRRRQPTRWGGRSKAFELWKVYQIHKAAQAEDKRRQAQLMAEIGARIQK